MKTDRLSGTVTGDLRKRRATSERHMSPGRWKAILFDFDGTLVGCSIDFAGVRRRIMELASGMGLEVPEERFLLELISRIVEANPGPSAGRFLRKALAIIEAEEMKSSRSARPIGNAAGFLRKLRRRGFKVGIITRNCRKAVVPILKRERFVFDVLLTREDVARVKPDPLHIRTALRALGVGPCETLVVGDHPLDIRSARRLGIRGIGVAASPERREAFRKEKPLFLVTSVEEMARFLDLEPLEPGKIPNELLGYLLSTYCKRDGSVLSGPAVGRDCALVRTAGRILALKSDPITLVGSDVGSYLVSVNANDLAVTGAVPRWFLTTLVFPEGVLFSSVETVFSQVSDACREAGVAWVGGHTEVSGSVRRAVCCGLMAGERLHRIRRRKARDGDALVQVKEAAIEAATVMARECRGTLARRFGSAALRAAADAVRKPGIGVFREALEIWQKFPAIAMHDPTEGGLSAGIQEMACLLGVGFRIEEGNLRFFPPGRRFAEHLGLSPLGALSSGCLLVVLPFRDAVRLKRYFRRRTACEIIGRVRPAREGVVLHSLAGDRPLPGFSRDEMTRLPLPGRT